MIKKLVFGVIAFGLLLGLLFTILPAIADTPTITEVPICTNTSCQHDPAIYDDIVVWSDERNSNFDIYSYNLSSASEFPVCNNSSDQAGPAIWDDIVVWYDERNGNYDIYGYNLSSDTEFPICNNSSGQYDPDIWGDIVVWRDGRNGNDDIYGYNLSNLTEFPVCNNSSVQRYPAIWGDIVVWEDWRDGNADIYGFNLSSDTEFPICNDSSGQSWPAIWDDIVVWYDGRNPEGWDIYGYNLSSDTEFPVCTNSSGQYYPAIWRDTVVWEDYRDGNADIYGFNLSSDTEFPICTNLSNQQFPDVWGDTAAWLDYRNDPPACGDIYGATLEWPTPTPTESPSPSATPSPSPSPSPTPTISTTPTPTTTVVASTSNGTWTVPACVTSVQVLVVAGGGGGGGAASSEYAGGGGGAGGLIYESNYSVTPGQNITVTVGDGGAGSNHGANGSDSVFGTLTAIGGGGGSGGGSSTAGYDGGSGGGGSGWQCGSSGGGSGTAGQGNSGGNGACVSMVPSSGGGGGNTSAGENGDGHGWGYGGNGGNGGNYSSIFGTSYGVNGVFAGGGGGGGWYGEGSGGSGGGGAGGYRSGALNGANATGNGSGGGGSYSTGSSQNGGAGSRGIVIVAYTAVCVPTPTPTESPSPTFSLTPSPTPAPTEVWVNADFNPSTPGWGYDHFANIQDGINAVSGSIVNVAAGTYYENIVLVDGVELLGAGNASTIIDGMQNGSVVTATGVGNTTRIDGFAITNGSAADFGGGLYLLNSSLNISSCNISNNLAVEDGGGMRMDNSSASVTSCTFWNNSAADDAGGIDVVTNSTLNITNCTFFNNSALIGTGGGIRNYTGCSMTAANCTIENNTAQFDGGGIYNYESNASFTSCTFVNNSAGTGGGMANYNASPTINNCAFGSNIAGGSGGGISNGGSSPYVANCTFTANQAGAYGGGGIYGDSGSSPIVVNCIFDSNTASGAPYAWGGGVYMAAMPDSNFVITNCAFWNNSADDGGGIGGTNSSTITNCILWQNTPDQISPTDLSTVSYSDIEDGYTGAGNNINSDPLFADAPNGDFHLTPSSPCIDTGNNSAPSIPATDFEGDARIVNGTVDMGADESTATVNIPVCSYSDDQISPQITSDGAGGAIITWQDYGSGSDWDIYAQRANDSGAPQWDDNGSVICIASLDQINPQITSDGAGGAIITWQDYRSDSDYDIYAQRVNGSGAVQWDADGVVICNASYWQSIPQITSDGAGGAIITWQDNRDYKDIYAQRVNDSGAVQWDADGVVICNASNRQEYPQIVSDGAGGAIITWRDYRGGGSADIYAQRVNDSGVQWDADGVVICNASRTQQDPHIISDGAGGAIITWQDLRNNNQDIYTQRVNDSGGVQWAANGVAICTDSAEQRFPKITSDGAGGAIIAWEDWRNSEFDIYAQRVNDSGMQWDTNGVVICNASNNQEQPQLISDNTNGAIITWVDDRDSYEVYDIYIQRLNASGAPQLTDNGSVICNASDTQLNPQLTSDGACGAFITWQDYRSGSDWDIYADRAALECPSPTPSPTVTPTPTINVTEFPVCTNTPACQQAPDISGDIVVWEDLRAGGVNWDIYGYNLSSDTEFTVCNNSSDQYYPAIWGDIVVWEDDRNGNSDIYGYNLSSDTEFPICNNSSDQYYPAIWGDIVVWEDSRNGNSDIYGYNLSSDTEFPICNNSSDQYAPAVWGDIVVWEDSRSGNYDIYGYNLSSSSEFPVCNNSSGQYVPAVWGDVVVWEDERDDEYGDIYGYNLSSDTEFPVCANSSDQYSPDISGDIVVWEDGRNGNSDIYGYNLPSDTESPICTNPADQYVPAVWGDTVVWEDERDDCGDIYGATLGWPVPTPTPSPSVSPTPTFSLTPSPTISATPTISPTPTPSASPTPYTLTPTESPTQTSTPPPTSTVMPTPSVTLPPIPDLVISNKSDEWVIEGTSYIVRYEICNRGGSSAPAGHDAALYIDYELVETQEIPVELGPRDCYSGQFNTTVNLSGCSDYIQVCADEFDEIEEIYEYDCWGNYMSAIPDLDISKWEEWSESGVSYTVHYYVYNWGGVTVPAGHDVALYVDGALVETQEVPADLEPNTGSYYYGGQFNTTVNFSGDSDDIEVCADHFNEVAEEWEDNCDYNTLTYLPDLYCSYKWEEWVVENVSYIVHYDVYNWGVATAPAGHDAALYVDDVLVETQEVPVDLSQWEGYTGHFNTTVNLSGKYDIIKVCVDEFDEVAEEDDENNCQYNSWGLGPAPTSTPTPAPGTTTPTVDMPDLGISKSEEWLEEGVSYIVHYRVCNYGDATAPAGHDVALYVDGALIETQEVPVALSPDHCYTGQFNTTVNFSGCLDHISVCADEFDEVEEYYEYNCNENTLTALPDLDISKGEGWIEGGVSYRVYYTVSNRGEVTATAGHDVALYVDGALVETQEVPVSLSPDDYYQGQFNTTINFSGDSDEIRVCADVFDEVEEESEYNCANNTLTYLPDLYCYKGEDWVQEGVSYIVYYQVGNGGYAPVLAGHDAALYVDGVLIETQEVPVNISPYDYYLGQFDSLVYISGSNDSIRVCADAFGEVEEGSESNNCSYNTLTKLPDLYVNYKWEEWSEAGVNYTVHYEIYNYGDVTAPAGHDAALYVDGALIETQRVPVSLSPGYSYQSKFNTTVNFSGDSDEIRICADSFNEVAEEYENNNCYNNTLTYLPNLYVCNKWEEWVEEGLSYTIHYEVCNWGDAPSPAGHDAALYVDDALIETQEVPVNISPGDDYTGQFNTTVNLSEGYDEIEVCADEFDEVQEESEYNCNYNYLTNLPALGISKWEEWVEEGVSYTVHYEVYNWGDVTAPAGHDAALYVDDALIETQEVPVNISPHDWYTSQFNTTINLSGEYDEIEVCPDIFDEVTEQYEDDPYRCNYNSLGSKPDLGIYKWEEWAEEGVSYTVHYEVNNWGDVTVPAGHDAALYVDGVLIEMQQVPSNISPHDYYTGQFNTTVYITGYSDTVQVCADVSDEVTEGWEDNNCDSNIWSGGPGPTPPAGGGGGGGGGGATPPRLAIDMFGYLDYCDTYSNGTSKEDFVGISRDGTIAIHISGGTEALDSEGSRLRNLHVKLVEPPPDPPEGCFVLAAFDFEPNDATFNPPMELTIAYDPDSLPEGMSEENLVIAVFNDETGEWEFLDCIVDTESHKVTVFISHLSVYALLAAPASSTPTPTATVTPPPSETPPPSTGGLGTGAWIGIIIGVLVVLGLAAGLWIIKRRRKSSQNTQPEKPLSQE